MLNGITFYKKILFCLLIVVFQSTAYADPYIPSYTTEEEWPLNSQCAEEEFSDPCFKKDQKNKSCQSQCSARKFEWLDQKLRGVNREDFPSIKEIIRISGPACNQDSYLRSAIERSEGNDLSITREIIIDCAIPIEITKTIIVPSNTKIRGKKNRAVLKPKGTLDVLGTRGESSKYDTKALGAALLLSEVEHVWIRGLEFITDDQMGVCMYHNSHANIIRVVSSKNILIEKNYFHKDKAPTPAQCDGIYEMLYVENGDYCGTRSDPHNEGENLDGKSLFPTENNAVSLYGENRNVTIRYNKAKGIDGRAFSVDSGAQDLAIYSNKAGETWCQGSHLVVESTQTEISGNFFYKPNANTSGNGKITAVGLTDQDGYRPKYIHLFKNVIIDSKWLDHNNDNKQISDDTNGYNYAPNNLSELPANQRDEVNGRGFAIMGNSSHVIIENNLFAGNSGNALFFHPTTQITLKNNDWDIIELNPGNPDSSFGSRPQYEIAEFPTCNETTKTSNCISAAICTANQLVRLENYGTKTWDGSQIFHLEGNDEFVPIDYISWMGPLFINGQETVTTIPAWSDNGERINICE